MLGIKYGETCPLKFVCKDKQGNPVDLTNCKILFELYDEVTDEECDDCCDSCMFCIVDNEK